MTVEERTKGIILALITFATAVSPGNLANITAGLMGLDAGCINSLAKSLREFALSASSCGGSTLFENTLYMAIANARSSNPDALKAFLEATEEVVS